MPNYNNRDRREVLIRQIREAIAEDNRKEIIERLLKGRQERVRKGHSPGGNVPYGYRREKKTLVPDDVEALVVRTILEAGQRGSLVAEIANLLNSQGLERRNGKPWTGRQVRAIQLNLPTWKHLNSLRDKGAPLTCREQAKP